MNVGNPRHKNTVLGSVLCRHDRGMLAKSADIWLSGQNVANMLATFPAKFPEEIMGTKTSPAAHHLFTVRDLSLAKALPEEQVMEFHCATAQLLFLSTRVRWDIQPATAFLTTRMRSPDKDNWGKVKRVLSYLKGTLHMPLILSADLLALSWWWVDVA